jgi:hypothetical protein
MCFFAAGYESHPFQFISASIPDVFTFPGNAKLSYHAIRKQDLPTGKVFSLRLKFSSLNFILLCHHFIIRNCSILRLA